jgi:hypothetical protein
MSLARGLERRLERLVDGLAARLFGGRVHPVELGERLVREADLGLTKGPLGPVAANDFVVTMGGDPADTGAIGPVQRELEQVIEITAVERGWRLDGPAHVSIVVGEGGEASVEVTGSIRPGSRPVWARLLPAHGRDLLEVTHNRSVIGRAGESDVHIPEPEISRRHALLWQEIGSVWVADLATANGTFVNGESASDPLAVAPGDVLGFGPASFVFKPV